MFELLEFIKRNCDSDNAEVMKSISQCSEHYQNMMEGEDQRHQALFDNIENLRDTTALKIESMQGKIEQLFHQYSKQISVQVEVRSLSPADLLV